MGRNLEIIGEAAARFDDVFRTSHSDVPWRAMTDARNILIRADYQVSAEILLGIVKTEIPLLLEPVNRILGSLESSGPVFNRLHLLDSLA